MEKGKKLKVYSDKDYTEIIDFPVELIGRDGVVRRYSYEESIRIYRRRIESAHLRYQDRDIVSAEIYHCTRRVEQIERSWRERISHSEQEYIAHRPTPAQREPYEQGKAFLNTYLASLLGDEARPIDASPNLVLLSDDPPVRVFFVNHFAFHQDTLLYVYSLKGGSEGKEGKRRYHDYLDVVQSAAPAAETEKLIHHGLRGEYAFILTSPRHSPIVRGVMVLPLRVDDGAARRPGMGASPGLRSMVEPLLNQPEHYLDTPLEVVCGALAQGQVVQAVEACQKILEENPYHRETYGVLVALCDSLGQWSDAEPYLVMGLRYFPQDAQLHLLVGLLRLRLADPHGALVAFEQAQDLAGDLQQLHLLMAQASIRIGNFVRARATLDEGVAVRPDDRALQAMARAFSQLEWVRKGVAAGAALATVVALTVAVERPQLGWWAVGVDVAVMASLLAGYLFWRSRRLSAYG